MTLLEQSCQSSMTESVVTFFNGFYRFGLVAKGHGITIEWGNYDVTLYADRLLAGIEINFFSHQPIWPQNV